MKKFLIMSFSLCVFMLTFSGCSDDSIENRIYTDETSFSLSIGNSKTIDIIAEINGKAENAELYIDTNQLKYTSVTKTYHNCSIDDNGNTVIKTSYSIKGISEGNEILRFTKINTPRYSSQHLDINVTVVK